MPLYKAVATIFTIATGGSGGKEGPISQVGAGIGVYVSNFVKAGARARRTLMLAGTAAGLGAIFKAPLGGALTATEMVYKKDIESNIADLKNIGDPRSYAGTITAGLFLKEFIEKTPWAHLDIAGTAWSEDTNNYLVQGGTGFGIRLLTKFLITESSK